uniref:Gag-Pol polyprotein n=1 Tax=Tanacetum cinerariifolium TaxID=118510 RepID=A0A699HR67_TANCI|nr:Gag-Pol polyprotein [Tanacetum cinerariifolium]
MFRCSDPNHLIGECSKPPNYNDQRAFIGSAWSDNGEDEVEKTKDETCLVAQAPDEICLGINLEANEWIKDIGCSKHMTGEYSQWVERFMDYLEEQVDGEAMINSIKNGDQPLPRVTQVSIAGTSSNEQPPLKDKSCDIYSLIDSNESAKDLWDALEKKMCGSEYGEQDMKAAILYEYETFKSIEGAQLLDTYLRYLQVINDLKKCGYKKDNCDLYYKFLNNLQPEWKHCGTLMRQTKNLIDINIDVLYNILKQNQGDVNDALGYKKKAIVVTSDPLALVAEKKKVSKRKEKVVVSSDSKGSDDKKVEKKDDEKKRDMSKVKCYNYKKKGHFAKDCKKAKVKDYNYYKTKMLLAKKDSDEQVLLVEDQAWMESISDSNHEINANMVFMAQIEKGSFRVRRKFFIC